jgi:hypothetical protein
VGDCLCFWTFSYFYYSVTVTACHSLPMEFVTE